MGIARLLPVQKLASDFRDFFFLVVAQECWQMMNMFIFLFPTACLNLNALAISKVDQSRTPEIHIAHTMDNRAVGTQSGSGFPSSQLEGLSFFSS